MAYLDKKSGRWMARISIDGTRYSRGGFTTRRNAETWEHQQRVKHERGVLGFPQQEDRKIEEIFREYVDKHQGKFRPDTLRQCHTCLRTWRKFFDAHAIVWVKQLNSGTMDTFVRYRAGGITPRGGPPKPSTVNFDLSTLQRILTWAVKRELIPEDPVTHYPFYKLDKPDVPRYLNKDEIALIERIAQERKSVVADAIAVLLRTGMRVREYCSLTRDNLDLERNQIILTAAQTKGRRPRAIPINAQVRAILEKAAAAPAGSTYLFTRDGIPLRSAAIMVGQGFTRLLKAAAREGMDIHGVNVHTLRKTYISQLVMEGADPVQVMAVVGHRDWATFQIYLALSKRYVAKTVDFLKY